MATAQTLTPVIFLIPSSKERVKYHTVQAEIVWDYLNISKTGVYLLVYITNYC